MAVIIYINGVRVAKGNKYDYSMNNDVNETETFDGIDLSPDESAKYEVNISKVDTYNSFEATLEKAMTEYPEGFPLVLQEDKVVVTCTGCYRTSKKVSRDPKTKRAIDLSFRATTLKEDYR